MDLSHPPEVQLSSPRDIHWAVDMIENLRRQIRDLTVRVTELEQSAVDGYGEEIGSTKAELKAYDKIVAGPDELRPYDKIVLGPTKAELEAYAKPQTKE